MSKVIDCKAISQKIRDEIRKDIEWCERVPTLVVIQVGDDPASTSYVTGKEKACKEVGIDVITVKLGDNIEEDDLISVIKFGSFVGYTGMRHEFFEPEYVDGILVQLPLPKHINERNVIDAIPPEKDVDGFTPINIGKMMLGDETAFIPCTPAGILEILKAENVETEGKHVVVVGRSNIVGRPIANLLSQKPWNAYVTICHSKMDEYDFAWNTRQADILIVATGHPDTILKDNVASKFPCGDWESNYPVIIDVGVNRIPDETKKSGFRLVGDVSKEALEWSYKYTPVPGGVGPMTITMLLKNTLQAYKLNH